MSATPAFKDRASEFAFGLPPGTRVEGNWGAMFPTDRGTVVGFDEVNCTHLIEWDEGSQVGSEGPTYYQIRRTRSVNGSPIGVWQA